MAKAPDLASAVHQASGPRRQKKKPDRPYSQPTTRQGTKGVVIHVTPEMSRALRKLAIDEDITLQALGVRAFEALLADVARRSGRSQ